MRARASLSCRYCKSWFRVGFAMVLHSANLRYFSLDEDGTACGLGLLEMELLALPTSDHSYHLPSESFSNPLV